MRHPTEGYSFGGLGVTMCVDEGKEVEVKEYARDDEMGIHYYSARCGCAWAATNLQYLEYKYDQLSKSR